MAHKKRRLRKPDPLANVATVRRICEALREQFPSLIPKPEKQLVSLLNAVRHAESYPATETNSGRPSHWRRNDLLAVSHALKAILARETQGRISLSSFVGVYLRILNAPTDVTDALECGQINLQEAILLARLTAERLAMTLPQAKKMRHDVLTVHVQAKGSQNSLRLRVQNLLGTESGLISSDTMAVVVQKVDELLEVDPDDVRHLFFEEIRNLFYALKEIEPVEVTEADLERFSRASDQVFNIIQGIRQRRKRQPESRPFQL